MAIGYRYCEYCGALKRIEHMHYVNVPSLGLCMPSFRNMMLLCVKCKKELGV